VSIAQVRRLNWGCGKSAAEGWLNSDRNPGPQVDIVGDIRKGLPLEDASIDYITSQHALQEVPFPDLVPALEELRRMLKPGGVLRLVVPNLDRGIQAYLRGEREYFPVPDGDARSLGGKFIVHILWYSHSRIMFTFDFLEELLRTAGFRRVVRCGFRHTASPHPEIVDLDEREHESLFVEAVK
jgi:predicted SAM-dependent methyltransferase